MSKVVISYYYYKLLFINYFYSKVLLFTYLFADMCIHKCVCMHTPTHVNRFMFFIIIYMCSVHVCGHACVCVCMYMDICIIVYLCNVFFHIFVYVKKLTIFTTSFVAAPN